HRPVDSLGATTFVTLLNGGLISRTQFVLAVEASVEYRTLQINTIYETLLHRPVEAGALKTFLGFLSPGGAFGQKQAVVASSDEFFMRSGGTNDGFVTALYQDALGRAPDAAGRAGFDSFLASGASRAQVATSIFTSAEYDRDLVNGWYSAFLRRPADANGL